MRIAFFGGSFDPPHRGHLAIAAAAADCFHLDRVLFAPVASQPLKQLSTPFAHRYAMVALATAGDPRFIPSLLDAPNGSLDKFSPNYTIDTLTRLRSELDSTDPSAQLFALTGADAFLDLARWRSPRQLLTLCDWIVASRPGFSLDSTLPLVQTILAPDISPAQLDPTTIRIDQAGLPPRHIHLLDDLDEHISATTFRQGVTTPSDLPDSVSAYIEKAGLYPR